MNTSSIVASIAASLVATAAAHAQVVFQADPDNGFFAPFNSGNASTVIYGDGGWIGGGSDDPASLGSITLGLAVYDGPRAGTTDIEFTFNDGDPSGLVFGSGATLYSTTIEGVKLPATGADEAVFFSLTIPLPNVQTMGGFNNIGWSIALANYDYDGDFGFQVSSCAGQVVGFYTNNASYFDGRAWSLFSFGSGCSGVANFVATVELATEAPCLGDFDENGEVDAADLAVLLGEWGTDGEADLDLSGTVDAADLAILLGNWGRCS